MVTSRRAGSRLARRRRADAPRRRPARLLTGALCPPSTGPPCPPQPCPGDRLPPTSLRAQQNAVVELRADRPGRRRARAPGSPPPGTSCTWSAAASATRCSAAPVTDLDFTTDARPGRGARARSTAGPTPSGTPGSRSARSAPAARGVTVEITTFRADAYDRVDPQPGRRLRRHARGRPGAARLHGQRDGRGAAGDERAFVDPYGGLAALAAGVLDTPATPEESFADDPLRMLRAARFVSQLGFTPAPRVRRGDDGDGRRAGPDHRRAGAGRADQADPRRAPAARARAAGRHRAGRARAARAAGAAPGDRRAHAAQGRLHALADRAGAGDRPGDRRSRTWCCGWPPCCTTSASRRPAASSRTAGSASTTTRWSGRSWPASGCASCATRRR